jgi:uncharacterized protein (TIGR03086 family)
MEMRQLMVPAAEETVAVVGGVAPALLSGPTPCPEYDVAGLLAHVADWTGVRALTAARKEPPPDTATDVTEVAEPGWTKRYAELARASASAWSEPEAWDGETGLSGAGRMPAGFIGGIVFGELLLHGWDLAVATGQRFAPDGELAATLFDRLTAMGDLARQGGVFGPEVAVPASAPAFDCALGLAGRDPAWTPGDARRAGDAGGAA